MFNFFAFSFENFCHLSVDIPKIFELCTRAKEISFLGIGFEMQLGDVLVLSKR